MAVSRAGANEKSEAWRALPFQNEDECGHGLKLCEDVLARDKRNERNRRERERRARRKLEKKAKDEDGGAGAVTQTGPDPRGGDCVISSVSAPPTTVESLTSPSRAFF